MSPLTYEPYPPLLPSVSLLATAIGFACVLVCCDPMWIFARVLCRTTLDLDLSILPSDHDK